MSDTEKELSPAKDGNKTEEKKSSEKNDIGPVEPELLKGLPPEAKKVLEIGMSMQRFGPMPNPLAKKPMENT
jgi:hypothetical protein